ncbi:putative hydrolase of the HAD superfamily [Rhodopseudomonas julia]|uniref:Hydrolase of the HAD superfamily n=1 Tax=Rhodopseudomonas julia TaxID=200617 RepID=A0ABU0C9F4_9BRAD|nr:HAD-IA family hydrolase [Rhodopseudomonas julia]MDQ0326837.1 putative hydrolase of the HAD superfamily [Rhodopseudomonas julia]
MKPCLMLDVDGVLVHGRPKGESWVENVERDLGVTPEILETCFFEPHWADVIVGKKQLMDVLERCLPPVAPWLAPQDFVDYWIANDSVLDEDLLSEADALRRHGMLVFLATNQEHMRARHLMERLRLAEHVDGIVYSAAVGARKPEPAFFDAALKLSGTAARDTVLVDDMRANVEAAREAGWLAIQWTRGGSLIRRLGAECRCIAEV